MSKSTILNESGQPFAYPDSSEIRAAGGLSNTQIDAVSISQVLSSMEMPSRSRWQIYQQYLYMMSDPIISTALKLHVTQSLGGHETTGEVIFIDKKPGIKAQEEKMVDEIQATLGPMLNNIAYQLCFMGTGMGDAYARLYGEKGKGVTKVDMSEFYIPALIQSFERAGTTTGFEVSVDNRVLVPLTVMQMARFKMPRMTFVPQPRAQYNHWRQAVAEDDVNKLPILPSLVGGSFLEAAEKPFFLLQSALTGLNSSRILDSVRENMLGVNMQDMTKDQQDQFFNSITGMLSASKKKAQDAIEKKIPIVEKIFHIIPTWREKQLYSVDQGGSIANTNAATYNTDDVMFYAKLLAGAFGLDLSMLGFSELLSGGLGDGGFFRVSAQSAERSRMIRQAMTGFVNHVIDVHCQYKYKGIFGDSNRPYEVDFIGSSSALDREQQETRERKTGAASAVMQVLQQMRELGFDQDSACHYLKEQMGFDEDDAKLYTKIFNSSNNDDNSGNDNQRYGGYQ